MVGYRKSAFDEPPTLWDMRSVGDFPRSSNIRPFESGPLGTRWRHLSHWKNDEDHAASIVNGAR